MPATPMQTLSRLLIPTLLIAGLSLTARPAQAAPPGDFYTWAKWRLGHAPYGCQAGAPWVRPNVERRVPASWWKRLESYKAAACTPAANPPSPNPGTEQPGETLVAVVKLDAREAALRDAVNAERARNGLAPLGLNAGLERAARGHIADIVRFRYFGHDWHDRTPFGKWIGRYSRCVTTGEILAWRTPQQTADNAVQQWLASPPHRVALLSPAWSVMGVELARQYAAVEFGSRC